MTVEYEDWDALSAEWRGHRPPSEAMPTEATERLRRRVQRHSRQQWILLAGEIVLTLYFGWVAWSAFLEPSGRGILAAIATVGVIGLVWTFAIRNRRGSWRPLGESTSDYLRLSHGRAEAGRRSISFVRRMVVGALLCYLPWFAFRLRDGAISGSEWWRWIFLLAYSAAFLSWCAWRSRRIGHEVAVLEEIEREVGG
jgi:hypothetical protein